MSTIQLTLSDEDIERIATRVAQLTGSGQKEGWLNVDQAATYLACAPHRIYDLISQGHLRSVRDGRRVLFQRSWLDEIPRYDQVA